MLHHSVGAWSLRSGRPNHRLTREEWNFIMPELLQLKRSKSNMQLLQCLLDEGITTSLSTLDRRFRALRDQQHQESASVDMFASSADTTPNQTFSIFSPDADNVTRYDEDEIQLATLQAIADTAPDSTKTTQCADDDDGDNDDAMIFPAATTSNDEILNQSLQPLWCDTMSVASIEEVALSLHSGDSRSNQDSSDKTIETESNCPSMFGRMLQTKKRAQKSLQAMGKDALRPRLPPSAPSRGQKVEEWHNSSWSMPVGSRLALSSGQTMRNLTFRLT